MNTQTVQELSDEHILEYLSNNPTFLLKHESLLADLYLPHASGDAVSLLERQVKILRERNIDTRKRLADMLEQGQRNDIVFNKTRTLVLYMLDSKSLSDLSKRVTEYCEKEFQVDKALLTLFATPETHHAATSCRIVAITEAERSMPGILNAAESVSGSFRSEELQFLFAGQHANLASAIALPISIDGRICGFLALGSDDAHYFKAGMDTLFLKFVGDVIAHLLPRFFK